MGADAKGDTGPVLDAKSGAIPLPAGLRRVPRAVLVGAVVGVIALLIGLIIGRLLPRDAAPEWQQADVQVSAGQAVAQIGGQSYGVIGAVPAWIDAEGKTQRFTWPTCLADADAGSTVSLRVAVVTVALDGARWGEIVGVDCRG